LGYYYLVKFIKITYFLNLVKIQFNLNLQIFGFGFGMLD